MRFFCRQGETLPPTTTPLYSHADPGHHIMKNQAAVGGSHHSIKIGQPTRLLGSSEGGALAMNNKIYHVPGSEKTATALRLELLDDDETTTCGGSTTSRLHRPLDHIEEDAIDIGYESVPDHGIMTICGDKQSSVQIQCGSDFEETVAATHSGSTSSSGSTSTCEPPSASTSTTASKVAASLDYHDHDDHDDHRCEEMVADSCPGSGSESAQAPPFAAIHGAGHFAPAKFLRPIAMVALVMLCATGAVNGQSTSASAQSYYRLTCFSTTRHQSIPSVLSLFVMASVGLAPIAQAQDSQEAFLTMSAQTDGQYWSWGSGYAGALANGTELLGLPRRSARRLQAQGGDVMGIGRTYLATASTNGFNAAELISSLGSDNAHVAVTVTGTSLVLKVGGSVWSFGAGWYSASGLGHTNDVQTPTQINIVGNDNTLVDCGYGSCFLLKQSGALYGWGMNNAGQIGLGYSSSYPTDYISEPTAVVAMGTDNVGIHAMSSFYYVIKSSGALFGTGSCQSGEFPNGNFGRLETFTEATLAGRDIVQIACGARHCHILKSSGGVWGWGETRWGRIGNGQGQGGVDDIFTPVQLTSLAEDNAQLAAGSRTAYVLKSDGSLKSWGHNGLGQLGLGTNSGPECYSEWGNCANVATSPVSLPLLGNDNAFVAAGKDTGWVIKTSGIVWSWGSTNYYGQTGQPGGGQKHPAEVTALSSPIGIVVGGDMLAIAITGSTYSYTCPVFGGCGSSNVDEPHFECTGAQYDDDNDPTTVCATCAPGAYATATTCTACEHGTADTDSNPATECVTCGPGTFSTASRTTCVACSAGTADTDSNPATACTNCETGKYTAAGSTSCSTCASG
eukprot:COSAG02_NODE_3720_length_6323_cov_7.586600_1_plen_847_part_10